MKKIKYITRDTRDILIEKPPGEKFLKFLYNNSYGKMPLNLIIKRKFLSTIYGNLMDTKKSKKKIMPFIRKYKIDTTEFEKKPNQFKSFNDFFYRKIKPNSRKIQNGLVSPADGKIIAFDDVSKINEFFVKGESFNLERFLCDENLVKKYHNSSIAIVRLAPDNYHRFHFPYDGIIGESKKIGGKYFSVSPYSLHENFTRVFCENKREYSILKTDELGDILISPIGATMVGSIINTYDRNSNIKKGSEMGYFAFGGSTILMLFDNKKVKIDDDIIQNTKNNLETKISMGEKIGFKR